MDMLSAWRPQPITGAHTSAHCQRRAILPNPPQTHAATPSPATLVRLVPSCPSLRGAPAWQLQACHVQPPQLQSSCACLRFASASPRSCGSGFLYPAWPVQHPVKPPIQLIGDRRHLKSTYSYIYTYVYIYIYYAHICM